MILQKYLAVFILLYGVLFGILECAKAYRERSALTEERGSFWKMSLAEGIVYFLSTMGFPDFVMNTLIFQKTSWIPEEKIPPSLVAVTVTPGAVIAFSYLRSNSQTGSLTLILCMAAIAAGSFTGAHLVISLSGELIQKLLTLAMLFSMAALIVKMIVSAGSTGTATDLTAGQLCIVIPVVFCFGFINMFGVPMKPAATALFLLMGLSPMTTLTLMLAMGFMSPMAGGIQVLKSGKYHKKLSVASVIFGTLGAVLGTFVTVSLNAMVLNIILLCIMGFTVITLSRSQGAKKNRRYGEK